MFEVSVGSHIEYKRGWTATRTHSACVTAVELSDTGEVVYILDDGHWCYYGQIIGVAGGTGYALY